MINPGDRFDGKYTILRRLGRGGFGEVYLAADDHIPDREVAIKVIHSVSNLDDSDLLWEMQALSKFSHPGIVAFYHHFREDNRLYLVMEYCNGGSLGELLVPSAKVPEQQALQWALDLCDTLGFVHGKGIVHHDIKPANILFAADGRIKLGDFGIANRQGGTRIYMAPEQWLGEPIAKTDPRIDIYALGITLLLILDGAHPFEGLNRDQQMRVAMARSFVPDTLPRWIQEVLLKATHPTPELRFQTAGDFAEAIRAKQVPYIFDGNRIKAHVLAEKAEGKIERRKWKDAQALLQHALQLSPDCVAALMAAGRCNLLTRRIDAARDCFNQAVALSPRTPAQKELGWLSLESGQLPTAISLLSDHLQRNSADFEAYNLLMKCFFLSDRYEAADDLARTVMKEKPPNDCFRSNRILCRLLSGGDDEGVQELELSDSEVNPFIGYNLRLMRETPRAWGGEGGPTLKSKLLFEEYRFGAAARSGKTNTVRFELGDRKRIDIEKPLITLGYLAANDIVLQRSRVSRRHAVVVNYPDDVWLYDLGSGWGAQLDGVAFSGRALIEGAHDVTLGPAKLRLAAKSNLLV